MLTWHLSFSNGCWYHKQICAVIDELEEAKWSCCGELLFGWVPCPAIISNAQPISSSGVGVYCCVLVTFFIVLFWGFWTPWMCYLMWVKSVRGLVCEFSCITYGEFQVCASESLWPQYISLVHFRFVEFSDLSVASRNTEYFSKARLHCRANYFRNWSFLMLELCWVTASVLWNTFWSLSSKQYIYKEKHSY